MNRSPSEGAPEPAAEVLEAKRRSVFKHLPEALSGEEEGIHQLRVASRRLREALPILSTKPEGRRVRRAVKILRDITRVAGRSRDLDVGVVLFEEHLEARGRGGAETDTLRTRLRSARARSRARMNEGLLDLEIAKLRRDLRVIRSRQAVGLFTVLSRLRRARDIGGARALAMLAALGTRYEPIELHRLRAVIRRLRYAAEVASEIRGEESEATASLKELQDRLGSIHDAHVLTAWLERQASAAEKRGRSRLTGAARGLAAEFLGIGHGLHRAFLEDEPAAVLRRALAGMLRSEPAA